MPYRTAKIRIIFEPTFTLPIKKNGAGMMNLQQTPYVILTGS